MSRLTTVLGILLVGILLSTDLTSYVKIYLHPSSDPKCQIYDALAPPGFYKDNSTVLRILNDPEYRLESVARLSGAVQVDTSVNDDFLDVSEDPETWKRFDKFEAYLKETFPAVFENSELTKVNSHGIILHWKGSDESLKPLLLTAHQDVVPVQHETVGDWTYPPFSGHYDGEYLYGRGSFDCKNSLIAVMEALELLMEGGYQNSRGVIAAFGFDEEITGNFGAKNIAKVLEQKFGPDSMYAIIDEGPGLLEDPITNTLIAVPGTGEKGLTDLKVQLFMPGGHSSMPPDHGAIGIMGELAMDIENDPYQAKLTEKNPILKFLQCVAAAGGDKMSTMQKKAILRADFDTFANKLVVDSLLKNKITRNLVRTSQAVDVIRGGEKINALPEEVSLLVNHRVSVDTTYEQVAEHFASRVHRLAIKYNLNVTEFGTQTHTAKNAAGAFFVTKLRNRIEVAPVTPSTGKVWEYLAGSTRHVFEHLVLNNTIGYPIVTAPAMMPANTDTRYYWALTRHIFRFAPMIVRLDHCNVHSVNEKIPFDGHLQLTAWYYQYIQNVDTKDADE